MILVVILAVRPEALNQFRTFETRAAAVMAKHGGALERAVVIPPRRPEEPLREVHIVRFPDEAAFAAYRQDPTLAEVRHLREASVLTTEILVGEEGPNYKSLAEQLP